MLVLVHCAYCILCLYFSFPCHPTCYALVCYYSSVKWSKIRQGLECDKINLYIYFQNMLLHTSLPDIEKSIYLVLPIISHCQEFN
jgi:hypothetical protein